MEGWKEEDGTGVGRRVCWDGEGVWEGEGKLRGFLFFFQAAPPPLFFLSGSGSGFCVVFKRLRLTF